ncbi:hypothetical protein NMY22_g11986 [Coprinellus aureogranulatus]|nr:hypothetical protein NMY22_g11986 [Coprinellus aureogranulatus]
MARVLQALGLLLYATWAVAVLPERYAGGQRLPFVPNKFIIEVDELARIHGRRDITRPWDAVYSSLRKRQLAVEVNREFDSPGIFTGAAITLNNAQDVSAIRSIEGVKSIRPIVKFNRPKPVSRKTVTSMDDPDIPAYARSSHVMTGIDKLHAEGLSGNGIQIAVIDTGIDYRHPALGGGFGPGFKVAGGFDLVGDDYTGNNQPVPDPDPLDCEGHGTHVAGIVGANPDNEFGIVGSAPNATLFAYRVFGCEGQVDEDVLVEAFIRAHEEGNDIITVSIGQPDGWAASTTSVVASRIASAGRIVTISAGNEAADGSWYASSPASGIDVIAIASVENTLVPLQSATVQGAEHDPIVYYSTFPLEITESLPIYVLSNGTSPNDACNPLPSTTPDLSTFLVIIRRGTCPFVQKLDNAAARGARYALIYDNGGGFNAIEVGDFAGRASLIREEDGLWLVEQWLADVNVTVSFPQTGGSVSFPSQQGGLVSDFSSYGPTNEFYFKPAVAAPGGNIISTVPDNGFAVLSGTSMAAPLAAGAGALLLEFKGKSAEVARSARSLLQTTAQYVHVDLTDNGPFQTLIQQGAGLINVYDALHTSTILSTGELILNDTANFKADHTFQVTNTGSERKEYAISHIPAATAETFIPGTNLTAFGPLALADAAGSATITPSTLVLEPGQSGEVEVSFTPPTGLDPTTFPVFSGFIQVATPSENPVHVSYVGGVGSLKDVTIIDTTEEVLNIPTPVLLDSNGEVQVSPTNYTFTEFDYPTLLWRQLFGSPLWRADLVDVNTTVRSTIQPRAIGLQERDEPVFSFPFEAARGSGTFAEVPTLGPIFEEAYIPRNDASNNPFYFFDLLEPTFANGTSIPNGSYRLLFRILKVTGDRTKQEDYESWLSPILGVQA